MLSLLRDKLILYLATTCHKQHDWSLCEKVETTRSIAIGVVTEVERFHHSYPIGLCWL